MSAPRQVLLLMLAIAIAQCAWYWPRLPAMVPSHVGLSGHVDSWSQKGTLIAIYLGVLLLTSMLLGGVGSIISGTPAALINLPRKDYWLAPERAASTRQYLGNQLGWMAVATAALQVAIFEMVFRAAVEGVRQLSPWPMLIVIGAYLAWTLIWVWRLIGHFARVSEDQAIE